MFKRKEHQHIHSQNNYCREKKHTKWDKVIFYLNKEVVQRTIRGLNKPIPEANYRSKKKNKKKKIHGNDKSFNFALAATKHVRMAPVMEEKKKQRRLSGTSDGREEEVEAPR